MIKDEVFGRLKHSLQLLASPASVQLELLPSFTCKADELALELDHWSEVVRRTYRRDLTDDQQSALVALEEKLKWLTKLGKDKWTDESVRNAQEWQDIRELAVTALKIFDWPLETPPSYSHEYVQGSSQGRFTQRKS